jgi:hypothetical protein
MTQEKTRKMKKLVRKHGIPEHLRAKVPPLPPFPFKTTISFLFLSPFSPPFSPPLLLPYFSPSVNFKHLKLLPLYLVFVIF